VWRLTAPVRLSVVCAIVATGALALSAGSLLAGGCSTPVGNLETTFSQTVADTQPLDHRTLVAGERVTADLDADQSLELIMIDPQDLSLHIEDGAISYHSRAKWRVFQALLGDTDNDTLTEVVALLDSAKGRHLGLFAYFGGEYRERLVTQEIGPAPIAIEIVHCGPATESTAPLVDTLAAGDVIVLVQEPPAGGTGTRRTLLRWNGFGFTRVEAASCPES
jgi:hypothetical protein